MEDSIDNHSMDSSHNMNRGLSINVAAQGIVGQAKQNEFYRTNDCTALMSMTIEQDGAPGGIASFMKKHNEEAHASRFKNARIDEIEKRNLDHMQRYSDPECAEAY